MTKTSRVTVIGVLLIGVICLSARVSAQQRPAIADQIAKTYGLDSWDQVEAIRYTFNVDWPALRLKASRSWVWEPKTDRVSYDGKDKDGNPVKVTYSRSQLASQSAVVKNEIDPAFNNDQYNLLFAFHIVWGYQRYGSGCRQAETAAGERFRRESRDELSFRGRLHA